MVFFQLLCGNTAFAQSRTITGSVKTKTGDAIPRATINQDGTNNYATANENGSFSINVSGNNVVLVVSSAGFSTASFDVGTASAYDAVLEQTGQLAEIVVTALGITRKQRALGYSTQQVKGENLTLTKEQNVLGSLAGKIAGVQVTGASGASMGGTQKIKIRGVNSLGGADQPLIVVDGTPISNSNFANADKADYGNLAQDINPEDIESVNVLKGPTASALYGLRGQYGVIMITTKKGKKGTKKISVQLNSAFSLERARNFLPVQNLYGGGSSQTWRTLANGEKYVDMSVDESWGPKLDGTPVRHAYSFYPLDVDYQKLTPFSPQPDNIKDFFETGSTLNNGITLTGGNENTNVRFSFNDTRVQGVEANTSLRRNNLGLNFGIDLTAKLNLGVNANYATNKAQRPTQGSEYGARYMTQWFQRNIDIKRLKNYKYSDGTFQNWSLNRPTAAGVINTKPLYWDNPYFDLYENLNKDNRDRLFGDIGLHYQLLPALKLSGFVRSDMFVQNIEEITAFGGRRVPSYNVGKYQNNERNYEFLAQYNKEIEEFSINANVGGNIFKRKYTYLYQQTVGGLSSRGYYNIEASIDRPINNSRILEKEIRSAYAMASIGYWNTIFVDASIRNDVTSTLPENNNSYWYPSVSTSFIFSELLDWKPMTSGKLRLSYAKAGSDLDPYGTTTSFAVGPVYTPVNTLAVPDVLNNSDIQPSFAHSYEIGADLLFFNSRLGIDFTYYEQKNKNQIINLDVSGASGFSVAKINAGLIQNKGFELSVTGRPLQTKSFSWTSTFNLARNRNSVVELYPGLNTYTYGSTTYSSVTSYLNSYTGKTFGSLVGQAYQRDSATGRILLGANNMPLFTAATTDFGTVLPKFTGGFLNTFRFKNFELSAMIDFQSGGQFFSRSKMLAVRTGQDPITVAINDKGFNVRDAVAAGGGVRVDGISAATKQPVTAYVDAQSYYNTVLGRRIYEEWIFDASYIKLREVRLGYNFDRKTLGKLPVRNLGLALIARNPAMIWQKAPKGLDASELSTGSQSIGWYESGQTNSVCSYGVNLNITF